MGQAQPNQVPAALSMICFRSRRSFIIYFVLAFVIATDHFLMSTATDACGAWKNARQNNSSYFADPCLKPIVPFIQDLYVYIFRILFASI